MFRKSALLLAAPLLLAAACAKEADDAAVEVVTGDVATVALRAAPEVAADAGTAQFEMVVETTMLGTPYEITATGAYDAASRQMSMSMDMGSMFQGLGKSAADALAEGVDGAWDFVADGDTVYLRAPFINLFLGAPGWISMSPDDLGSSAGGLGLGAGAYDPSKILEALRGVAGEPEVVGQEEIRGVDTTHYRAELDLADALAEVPEAERAAVEASLEQIGDLGSVTVPVDVWIDGDGLPRRLQMDMGGTFGQVGVGDLGLTMTFDLFGYGEDVAIEVPPADEVTPFTEIMGSFGQGFGSEA